MNTKRMNIVIDLLNLCIYSYPCMCMVAVIFYLISGSQKSAWLSCVLLPAFLLSYAVQKLTRHLSFFLALHLLLAYLMSLTGHTLYFQIILFILGLIIGTVSLYTRIHGEQHTKSAASPLLLIFVVISYIICSYKNIAFLQPHIATGLMISILFYCIIRYLINFRSYFLTNQLKANVPLGPIRRTCHGFMAIFTALSAILMIWILKLPLERLLNGINHGFFNLLKCLISLLRHQPAVSEQVRSTGDKALELPPGETSLFWEILSKILMYAGYLAIGIGIIAAIVFLCFQIAKGFHRNTRTASTDHKEFISPFTIKKEKAHVSRKESRHTFFLFASVKDKMRRHFYQQIKPKVDSRTAPYLTSSQLTHSVDDSGSGLLKEHHNEDDLKKLHLLYDKARYSNQECTKEDYQQIKQIKL